MPQVAFASNLLWVMVIGLLGPLLPAIIMDLGITYTQAGLFFTLLSLGSLLGTPIGGIASDHLNRKIVFAGFAAFLVAGLSSIGFAPSYLQILLVIFIFSFFGSPIGAIGQAIMLDMFPEKRARYLSLMAMFAAVGSFLAPLLIYLNYSAGLSWRWPFIETGGLVALLIIAIALVPIPQAKKQAINKMNFFGILGSREVLLSAVLIFFSVGPDLGFSYWLAEYYKTGLRVSLKLSSAVVGIFQAGLIGGRFLASWLLKSYRPEKIMIAGLTAALTCLAIFLAVPLVPVKTVLIFFYGLGLAPVFPLLMARGTAAFPDRSGTVSGVLFAFLSLGGMVFPFLYGAAASVISIERTYLLNEAVVLALLIAVIVTARRKKRPG